MIILSQAVMEGASISIIKILLGFHVNLKRFVAIRNSLRQFTSLSLPNIAVHVTFP